LPPENSAFPVSDWWHPLQTILSEQWHYLPKPFYNSVYSRRIVVIIFLPLNLCFTLKIGSAKIQFILILQDVL
jgi:hypothetical protein